MTYGAAKTIIMTAFTSHELARLNAAVSLHFMEQIGEPDFEQVWFDNISEELEAEWDTYARYHDEHAGRT